MPTSARPDRPGASLQNLLLGLGTALLAGAAFVFVAVTWDRLNAAVQGAILLGLTAAFAGAAVLASRRRMPATAEAVGLVAVLFSVADAHAARLTFGSHVTSSAWWAGSVAVLAVVAWVLGDAASIRSARMASALGGQLALPLALLTIRPTDDVSIGALLAQAALVVVVAARWVRAPGAARVVAAVGASVTWTVATSWAAVWAAYEVGGSNSRTPAALLLAATAVAGMAAWLSADRDDARPPATLAATGCGLVSAWAFASVTWATPVADGVLAVVTATVLAGAVRLDRRWRTEATLVAGVGTALTAVPLFGALMVSLGGSLDLAVTRAWALDPGTSARTLLVESVDPVVVRPLAIALHLVAMVLLVTVVVPVRRRGLGLRHVAAAVTVLAVAPLVLPLGVAGTVAVALAGVVSAVALAVGAGPVAERLGGGPGALLVRAAWLGAASSVLALVWATADPTLTVVAVAGVTGAAAGFVVVARNRSEVQVGSASAIVAALGAALLVGVMLGATGHDGGMSLVLGGVTALVVGFAAAQLLDPSGRSRGIDGALSHSVEVATWCAHGVVLNAVAQPGGWGPGARVTLAAGAVTAAVHATRPGRRWLWGLAAFEGLLLTWTQLHLAGVGTPEAYSLPVAAVLLATGLVGEHRQREAGEVSSSWTTLGPALVAALAPSVLIGLGDTGLVRPILGLLAGAAVLVAGAFHQRRAAVDVGVATVAALGLRLVVPLVGELPAWTTLAATGTVLVAVGATFEQRRRDLRQARVRYGQLT